MRIGIDVFGGDFAPEATVLGSMLATKVISPDVKLVLIGDREQIVTICKGEKFDPAVFEIVHTIERIEMGEYPARAFSQKPNSSIVLGFKLLAQGNLDGLLSAGNTGAMLVGAIQVVKSVPGIIRPCIAAALPRPDHHPILLLDVGLNPDCRPDVLYQYAILGQIYATQVLNISNPKVGLLNIGSEEEKGNLLTKATYLAMKDTKDFNFIGNVEANELFSNKTDIIVCDGFAGNVMLKEAEAFYSIVKKRNINDDFFEKFNYVNYGGTPILGINAPVLIGHGISDAIAIKNIILHASVVIKSDICGKIKEAFK